MDTVKVYDKEFKLVISYFDIVKAIKKIADQLNHDFTDNDCPVFVSVLNGSFMFAGDLLKELDFQSVIHFVKLSSYKGENTSGKVKEIIGLDENIYKRNVIILEDILDTGITIEYVYNKLLKHKPKSLKIATLFLKKEAYKAKLSIDYIGMDVPNKFLIGYGLDYNGIGRNYKNIYELVE